MFFLFSVPSLFHVVVPVSLLSFTGKSLILLPEYEGLQTKPNRTVVPLANTTYSFHYFITRLKGTPLF